MVDPTAKGSEAVEAGNGNPNEVSSGESSMNENQQKKTCADCGTSKTPLWRGGPAGPKSLCNACGIRSRKKKRAILGISKGSTDQDHRKGKRINNSGGSNKFGDSFEQRLLALGKEVLMQRSNVDQRQRKKLGEEEQAAVLLMSLSYGSVYA